MGGADCIDDVTDQFSGKYDDAILDEVLELPNYHEPIDGPLAERVSDGRAVIEMLGVVTP